MKRFVTICIKAENVHLVKDVGMIPFYMQENGFSSELVCDGTKKEYQYANKELKDFRVTKIGYKKLALVNYIFKEGKSIDVLNMYHISIHKTLFYLVLYKIINPKGIAFLKTDLDYRGISSLENYRGLKKFLVEKMINKVDLVTSESREFAQRLSDLYKKKCYYLPNGVNVGSQVDLCNIRNNSFLTVGRLGSEQKNTKFLIDCYKSIYKKISWNLVLVGPITKQLNEYLEYLFKCNYELKERIIYKGEITDREQLYMEYLSAKCFVLPSKWESFGIVILEAMNAGDYLLISDQIPPAKDLIEDTCGQSISIENMKLWTDKMIEITHKNIDHVHINRIAQKYDWKKICQLLAMYLKNCAS